MYKMRPATEVFTSQERSWIAGGVLVICVLSMIVGTVSAIVR